MISNGDELLRASVIQNDPTNFKILLVMFGMSIERFVIVKARNIAACF